MIIPPYISFPFLIGRIRTKYICTFATTLSRFPFLIGRIRTISFIKGFTKRAKFPFLIGRIRTKYPSSLMYNGTAVSIPHR